MQTEFAETKNIKHILGDREQDIGQADGFGGRELKSNNPKDSGPVQGQPDGGGHPGGVHRRQQGDSDPLSGPGVRGPHNVIRGLDQAGAGMHGAAELQGQLHSGNLGGGVGPNGAGDEGGRIPHRDVCRHRRPREANPGNQGVGGAPIDRTRAIQGYGDRPPQGSDTVWPPWDGQDPIGQGGGQCDQCNLPQGGGVRISEEVSGGRPQIGEGPLQDGVGLCALHRVHRRDRCHRAQEEGHFLLRWAGDTAHDAGAPQPAGRVRQEGGGEGDNGDQSHILARSRAHKAGEDRQKDRVLDAHLRNKDIYIRDTHQENESR